MGDWSKKANKARKKVLELIYKAQTSHIGSNFSCLDILTVLFEHIDLDRDKFILSKGWAAASLYYFLWKKGRITEDELNSYCANGSKFIGLAEPIHKDIVFAGGSMCMGIAAGVGFALAKKLKGEQGRIYVLESDGAMQGGITWEAALIAAHHQLNNLVVFVDSNRLQAMGKTDSILSLFPLEEKWRSFGWDVREINGHNFEAIENAILAPPTEKPLVIICHTVKGRGVLEWEGNNLWHYKAPNEAEYKEALACLT